MRQAMTFRAGALQHLEKLARRAMLRTYRSSKLDAAFSVLQRSADIKRLERLKDQMEPIHREDRFSVAKYADFPMWSLCNIHRAAQLGLHKASGLRILDIGAGPGYFIAAARALGHDCVGIDVAESCFTPLERQVYSEVLTALNCRQHVLPIPVRRFEPLNVGGAPFDLITAFLICFNRDEKGGQWGVPEWRFFVEDALKNVSAGGQLYLGLNPDPKGFGDMKFYDEALLTYFQSVGAVDGARISIRVGPRERNGNSRH